MPDPLHPTLPARHERPAYTWEDPRRLGLDLDATSDSPPISVDDLRFPPTHHCQSDHTKAAPREVEPPRQKRLGSSYQPDSSHTYLIGIKGSGLVKIGWAKDPKKRLALLQIGHPMVLSLLWVTKGPYERALHRRFAGHRVRGEWFDFTPLGDPVEVVEAAVAEIGATVT